MYIISIGLLLYVQKHATASYDSVCKKWRLENVWKWEKDHFQEVDLRHVFGDLGSRSCLRVNTFPMQCEILISSSCR